jgi:hypothetical protein
MYRYGISSAPGGWNGHGKDAFGNLITNGGYTYVCPVYNDETNTWEISKYFVPIKH